jgi:hypothetical protein
VSGLPAEKKARLEGERQARNWVFGQTGGSPGLETGGREWIGSAMSLCNCDFHSLQPSFLVFKMWILHSTQRGRYENER